MLNRLERVTFLLLGGMMLQFVPGSSAQTTQQGPPLPDGGTREVLVSIFIPSVPNAAFTATVNTEWVRALADGTRITLRNQRLIARDRSGRIFQERRSLVPQDSKQESGVTQTEISDPVLHLQYICVPQQRVCQLEGFQPAEGELPTTRGPRNTSRAPGQQSLGTQEIAGVKTEGTREIATIPTGAIGNDSPILARREFWYSPQLGLNILSIREDPRFGTQKFELSDVVLGEPDSKLFSPPEGSKVIDLRNAEGKEAPQVPSNQ